MLVKSGVDWGFVERARRKREDKYGEQLDQARCRQARRLHVVGRMPVRATKVFKANRAGRDLESSKVWGLASKRERKRGSAAWNHWERSFWTMRTPRGWRRR
jgi:hypothetical protein